MNVLRTIGTAWSRVPQVYRLFRDGRVPRSLKIGAVVLALLIVSPLDLLGDIPIVGAFDDLALLALLVNFFVSLADRAVARVEDRDAPRRVGPGALLAGR